MTENRILLFENKSIRTAWNENKQELLLSVSDVIEALTDSADVKQYIKKLRGRDPSLDSRWGTICTPFAMTAADGKMRRTTVTNIEGVLEILQSLASPKTKQFEQWLESIGKENTLPSIENNGEIVLYQPDDSIKMEVFLENENVWINRQQMAVLFDRDVKTIGKHITNASREELSGIPTVAKFATLQTEGSRQILREVEYYNLDMILSVGYRVKSNRGIQFRRWANGVLKEYIIKGYAANHRFEQLENRATYHDNKIAVHDEKIAVQDKKIAIHDEKIAVHDEKIGFFIRTSLPPNHGILFEGQIFDAHVLTSKLIGTAKESIVLLDNYIDASVLLQLSERNKGVTADIFTKQISPRLKLDIEKHNTQYDGINVHESDKFHDRFLIIDHVVYFIGSSLKDLGKKMTVFSKMEVNDREILDKL
jgi:hypothetical protein